MFSRFVTMIIIIFIIMAFDDWLTVRMCDSNGHFTSFFSGQYSCERIEKE